MDRTDEVVLQTIGKIGTYGVAIMGIGGGEGTVPWYYTVGLTEKAHPEIVLVGGIKYAYAASTLNDLADRVIKHGAVFKPGDRLDDVIVHYDVVFAGPVSPAWQRLYPVSMANTIYGPERVTAIQMVYPDKNGFFPWDDGYDLRAQILLAPTPPGVR